MSILVDQQTKVVVQGITGRGGSRHAERMQAYGTDIVAGVTPGRGGDWILGVPVFDTVQEAVESMGVNTSVVFVPPPSAADAIMEAAAAGIELIVCITDGIPVQDMLQVRQFLAHTNARLIGPNSPGVITPAIASVGIMPARRFPELAKSKSNGRRSDIVRQTEIFLPGNVGVVSRSGTLTYEIVRFLTMAGIGQSSVVGIGGDPIVGTDFVEILEMFNTDPDTMQIVMIGEIGGSDEQQAAVYLAKNKNKPVTAFIAGMSAPLDKQLGHPGAKISAPHEKASHKIEALREAKVDIAYLPKQVLQQVVRNFRA